MLCHFFVFMFYLVTSSKITSKQNTHVNSDALDFGPLGWNNAILT